MTPSTDEPSDLGHRRVPGEGRCAARGGGSGGGSGECAHILLRFLRSALARQLIIHSIFLPMLFAPYLGSCRPPSSPATPIKT
eukprot:2144944-Rhodomonas_salina.3